MNSPVSGSEAQFIVAATDGSEGADNAVEWAAGEAAKRDLPLKVIRCWDDSHRHTRFDPAGVAHVEDEHRLNEFLARDLISLRHRHPGLTVSAHLVDGAPAEVLIEESARAALVVLGTRNLSAFSSAVLGSVSAAVAARSTCPVVVVRAPDAQTTKLRGVVAAINPADDPHAILDFAFAYASTHKVPLRVVTCAHRDLQTPGHGSYAHLIEAQLKPTIEDAVAPWHEKYADVALSTEVLVEHRVVALVEESAAAELLVVGRRGHHPVLGSLLGSVSQGVLHHARCPVAVVPQ